MYNRYLPGALPDTDYTSVAASAATQERPQPLLRLLHRDGNEGHLSSLFDGLLHNFKLPAFELDDLLLLGIIFLLLRENGDDDLILIIAALYFLGGGDT